MSLETKEAFTIRLDRKTIERLKALANEKGVRPRTLAQEAIAFFTGTLPNRGY